MAITDNLVSYWKLNESSGNAADSRAANTLTNNNTTYGAGRIGNGAVLNGTTSNLAIASNLGITGITNVSISVWAKIALENEAGTPQYVFACIATGATGMTFGITYEYNGGTRRTWAFVYTGTLYQSIKTGALGTANWYHFVATLSGTSLTLYANGVAQTPATIAGSFAAASNFTIGTDENVTGFVNGTVDEVGIWSRALTPSEVVQLYNSGGGLPYSFASNSLLLGVGT